MRVERCSIIWEKDKNLEESLLLCPFSRIMILGSCLGPLPSKTCVWCLVNDTRYEFHLVEWEGIKSNQIIAGYYQSVHATIAPMSTCCQDSHCGSHLRKISAYFSPLGYPLLISETRCFWYWTWTLSVTLVSHSGTRRVKNLHCLFCELWLPPKLANT